MSQHHFTRYAVEPLFKICLGDKCLYIKPGKIFTGGCVKMKHKIGAVVRKILYSLHT